MENSPAEPTTQKKGNTPDATRNIARPAEQRGRRLAQVVLGGFLTMAFIVEFLDVRPSDLDSALGDPGMGTLAFRPARITTMGWAQIIAWNGLVYLTFGGAGWARWLTAMIALFRGSFALFHAVSSGMRSGLHVSFACMGLLWCLGGLVLLNAPDLRLFFESQRRRKPA